MMLVQVVGDRPIGETHVSQLESIIQMTQFRQLVDADVAHGLWVFEWCVGQLMWLPNAAAAAALRAALIQITETLRDWCERAPSETGTVDPGTAASSLVLNAVGLALVPTDVAERVDRLASTLGEIIDIWPATRPGALMVANSVLRRVSPEIAGSIRRLLVRLRAMEASPI